MQLPGLDTAPDVTIARFVADTNAALEGTGAELGISVFGISATRPEPTAQDMRLLAPHVDYVSPMVYPSHWSSGEYEVADPVRQPADIVTRSVADFERIVAGSGAAVVPWLQDFSSGSVMYGPAEVRAQIDAGACGRRRGLPPVEPDVAVQRRRPRPAGGMTRASSVHVAVADGVATITLDSPANRNALSKALVADLNAALDTAEAADGSVRAIVLTHTPPAFCAGADLKERREGHPTRRRSSPCCGG